MTSYDIGRLFGHLQIKLWRRKHKDIVKIDISAMAKVSYIEQASLFTSLCEVDFTDGFTDGTEEAIKGICLEVEK